MDELERLDPRRVVTWAGEGLIRGLTIADEHLKFALHIFKDAKDQALRDFVFGVTERIQHAVGETEAGETVANKFLETAGSIFCRAAKPVVQTMLFRLINGTLMAFGENDFAQALLVWRGIFTNNANTTTVAFVLQNIHSLVDFLIGLIEPAKCSVKADSTDGVPDHQNPHSQYNRYNELDLANAMNRHTIITQLQRLAKSLSHIFLVAGTPHRSLQELPMDTSLRSDFNHIGGSAIPSFIRVGPDSNGQSHSNHGEQWLFINGISGELYWLQLYCKKLANIFQRDIRGIFNRSDGILWDLIECAGERDVANGENDLIDRTSSSIAAQMVLSTELSNALEKPQDTGYVVMIAYSQGCLLLRKVLQSLAVNPRYQRVMQRRLRVFTFGNPSIDWMGLNAQSDKFRLADYVNFTEHFANASDFVAKLGVLRNTTPRALHDLGFVDNNASLFINEGNDWIGHLFGAQYSLSPEDYNSGNSSRLLRCARGVAM